MIKYTSLIIVIFVALSGQAYACKCIGPEKYDVIFEGKVIKIEADHDAIDTNHFYTVHFKVERAIKGTQESEIIINTAASLFCGVKYKLNDTYTVYAINNGHLQTKYCYGKELQ